MSPKRRQGDTTLSVRSAVLLTAVLLTDSCLCFQSSSRNHAAALLLPAECRRRGDAAVGNGGALILPSTRKCGRLNLLQRPSYFPKIPKSNFATVPSSASSDEEGTSSPTACSTNNRLDDVLSRLTLGFPLYVLLAAVVGLYRPSLLEWVNRGNLISILLAGVMCGTGLTLQAEDFRKIPPSLVAFGVACQFGIMPLSAWLVGKFLLQQSSLDLFLGLCLVGCSPGGTASNLVSLIANADVALSVILTACSTLLAVVVTPALVKLLVSTSDIALSGFALVQATAKVVFAPVLLGMFLKAKAPKVADSLSRFTPFCSTLLVALICGGVVAQNTIEWNLASSSVASQLLPRVIASVFSLHSLGFLAGFLLPRWWLSSRLRPAQSLNNTKTARTISIEVGMQNSALAVVLARSIPSTTALAALPGAMSATVHSFLGSLLAALWRSQDEFNTKRHVIPEILPPDEHDNEPEFSI